MPNDNFSDSPKGTKNPDDKSAIASQDIREDREKGTSLSFFKKLPLVLKIFLVLLIILAVFLVVVWISYKRSNSYYLKIPAVERVSFDFVEYKPESTSFSPQVPGYSINVSELYNLADFEDSNGAAFSDVQRKSLESDNFFISENLVHFYSDDPNSDTRRSDDWTYWYKDIGGSLSAYYREPEDSVFVTSDYLLHVYHKLIEKEFEYIEQNQFYPKLSEITDALYYQAMFNYDLSNNDDLKHSYERLIAFFAVPKAILDSAYDEYLTQSPVDTSVDTVSNVLVQLDLMKSDGIPQPSYDMAKKEVSLIMSKQDVVESPLFGELLKEEGLSNLHDYTQYGPRSHYNKNSVLRSYFRTMMWYGRNNFALSSEELTRDAILITSLVNQTGCVKDWEDIYIPTSFFVGQSDDLGLYEYSEVLTAFEGKSIDSSLVNQVQNDLESYKGPQIMSSVFYGDQVFDLTKEELLDKTKGFRFMGQRFTPDAFIFSTLTQGDEKEDPETGEKLPSSTTALLVMSSFGNKTADELSDKWVQTEASDSTNVLNNRRTVLKNYFANLSDNDWTQNIYWSWLYTIKSLFTEDIDKSGYPMFMNSRLWPKKDLQASLGSWTELKHDTLLYAKQNYAEMGSGGPPPELPPVSKGYVEPNIIFFDRLIALSKMTYQGLLDRDLIGSEFMGRNEKFIDSLEFFREIAVKELQNEVISDDDFERLRLEPGSLSGVISPLPNETFTEEDVRSALIADVHTDAKKGEILYEATGIPNYIYVAIKDTNGVRLTKGLVFSYYEFTGPLSDRLNDEVWKENVYKDDKSNLPLQPEWSLTLIK